MEISFFTDLFQLISKYAPWFVGLVMPVIIDAVNFKIPKNLGGLKALIAVISCIVAALILKIGDLQLGQLNIAEVERFAGIMFAEATVVFHAWYRRSETRAELLERINSKSQPIVKGDTTPTPTPPQATSQDIG